MLGPCFVLQYFLSFLVSQSSRWGKEGWLLYVCWFSECHVIFVTLLTFTGHTHIFSKNDTWCNM